MKSALSQQHSNIHEEKTNVQVDPEPSSDQPQLPFEERVEKLVALLGSQPDVPLAARTLSREEVHTKEYKKLRTLHHDPKEQQRKRIRELINNLLDTPEELAKSVISGTVDVSKQVVIDFKDSAAYIVSTQTAKDIGQSLSSDLNGIKWHITTTEWYKKLFTQTKWAIIKGANSLARVALPQYNFMVPEMAEKAEDVKRKLHYIFDTAKQRIFKKK